MDRRQTDADEERMRILSERPKAPKTKRERERERRIRDGLATYRGIPKSLQEKLKAVAKELEVRFALETRFIDEPTLL